MDNPSVKVFEKDGKWEFEAIAFDEKYGSKAEVDELHKYAINQPIVYRHEHPLANSKALIFGRVKESEVIPVDKDRYGLKIKGNLSSYTEKHKKLIELVEARQKLGKPMGVSPQFQEFGNEKNPRALELLEFSLTHIPECEECQVGRIHKMEDEEKKKLEAKISELQKALDDTIGISKKFESEKKAQEEKFTADIEAVKKAFEQQMEAAKREPFIEELKSLEKDEVTFKLYEKHGSIDQIKGRIVKLKSTLAPAPAAVETIEQSRIKALERDGKEEWKKKFGENIKNLPEDIRKLLGGI